MRMSGVRPAFGQINIRIRRAVNVKNLKCKDDLQASAPVRFVLYSGPIILMGRHFNFNHPSTYCFFFRCLANTFCIYIKSRGPFSDCKNTVNTIPRKRSVDSDIKVEYLCVLFSYIYIYVY